ncbi:hypothetical protein [Lewinella sp. JB7]|nr:hypothetical protein [Lewinella sp. JB7]MCP9236989.1 hypothetical protein [Lewinella sp. JB7]
MLTFFRPSLIEDDQYQPTQDDLDNRSRQLNDQDDRYYQSRGQDGRPAGK